MSEALEAKKGLVHYPQGVILPFWMEDFTTDTQLNKGQEYFCCLGGHFFALRRRSQHTWNERERIGRRQKNNLSR